MQIDELLQPTSLFGMEQQTAMRRMWDHANEEAHKLVIQWHQNKKQDPSSPHPTIAIIDDIKRLMRTKSSVDHATRTC